MFICNVQNIFVKKNIKEFHVAIVLNPAITLSKEYNTRVLTVNS